MKILLGVSGCLSESHLFELEFILISEVVVVDGGAEQVEENAQLQALQEGLVVCLAHHECHCEK